MTPATATCPLRISTKTKNNLTETLVLFLSYSIHMPRNILNYTAAVSVYILSNSSFFTTVFLSYRLYITSSLNKLSLVTSRRLA